MVSAGCRPTPSTLPVIAPAPEFTLLDQRGQPFSSADLGGKVVLGNFVFTRCSDICPALSVTMSQVQERLREARLLGSKAILLSFSVDPEHDTPQALGEYAQRFGAEPDTWRFLTGDRAQIDDLLNTGFRLGAPRPVVGSSRPEIIHTSRFVLIDPRGQIRSYPRGEEVDVGQLVDEMRKLVAA